MLSLLRCYTWAVVVLLGTAGWAQERQPELVPRPGVLILRGDRVIQGDVLRVADHYVVNLSAGSQVNIPVERVQFRCDSMHAAYRHKAGALGSAAKSNDHLRLGDWCLRYRLLAEAAEQLLAAMRLEPDSPEVARFETRLRIAAHPPARTAPIPVPAIRQPVPQASLDRVVQALPGTAVDQFTRVIQPLLLNRCATANCHGPSHQGTFQLTRPARGQSLTRRFTQRNLYSVLQSLDAKAPSRSPLLTRATEAHARQARPGIDPKEVAQLAELAAWVHQVARGTSPARPAAIAAQSPLLLQPNRHPTPALGVPRARGSAATPNNAAAKTSPRAEPPRTDPTSTGATVRATDPFDPDEFNRRYVQRASKDSPPPDGP